MDKAWAMLVIEFMDGEETDVKFGKLNDGPMGAYAWIVRDQRLIITYHSRSYREEYPLCNIRRIRVFTNAEGIRGDERSEISHATGSAHTVESPSGT